MWENKHYSMALIIQHEHAASYNMHTSRTYVFKTIILYETSFTSYISAFKLFN